MRLEAGLLFLCLSVSAFADELVGRWEGSIQIPDRELNFIVDLDRPAGKDWAGSAIIPGLGVKGAPLADLAVRGSTLSFTIKGALANERTGPTRLEGKLASDGALIGNFSQAKNSASFVLRKTGPPQVELPRQSTVVGKEFTGAWKGDYEMFGYPRHVTLTLANQSTGPATAKLVVVGTRTTDAPVSLVTDENGFLTIESQEIGIGYEGRLRKDLIQGTFKLGSLELPLVLHRAAKTE